MRKLIQILILIGACSIVMVSGCIGASSTNTTHKNTTVQNNTKNINYSTFENEYITFNYPKGWTVKDNPKNGRLSVDINSSTIKGGSFHIYPLSVFESNYPGQEATLQNLASNIQSEGNYQAGLNEVNVAGTKGLQYSPLSKNNEGISYYNLYLQKGNDFYVLTIPTSDYNKDTDGISLIVNSLQFK